MMARAILWLACAACLAMQFLVPPFIGIANNADFGKVAGHLALYARDGGESNFAYFQPDYIHAARNYWDSPYTSSEAVLGWVAMHVSGATGENRHFDIRWLGAIHALLFLTALALLLRYSRLPVAALAILAFTDVGYAAYLNTFYMDAASLGTLLIMAAAACWIALTPAATLPQLSLFACAALIFATSKSQHALWSFLPALFLVFSGAKGIARRFAIVCGLLVFACGSAMVVAADRTNTAQALFDKLFLDIGVAPTGVPDLRDLGVRPEEMRYIGTHAFAPGSPVQDQAWAKAFLARTGYRRLAIWYIEHLGRTLQILGRTVATDAAVMRPRELSNFRRIDGHPPGAITDRFSLWTGFRSRLYGWWPFHIVLWYALFAGVSLYARAHPRSIFEGRLARIALGLVIFAAGEFLVAALADAVDTTRHLLLFHAATDLTFCFALAFALSRIPAFKSRG